jgi:hypothetical protein
VTSLEAMLAPLPLSSAIVIVQPIAAAGRDASACRRAPSRRLRVSKAKSSSRRLRLKRKPARRKAGAGRRA